MSTFVYVGKVGSLLNVYIDKKNFVEPTFHDVGT